MPCDTNGSKFAAHQPRSIFSARLTRWLASGALLPLGLGCSFAAQLDYTHLFSRQGYQRTDRVLETLALAPGDHVADLGAGDGYFAFHFADAVGPTGRVYAVDIDAEKIAGLRAEIERRGYSNIVAVLAEPDDAKLPETRIDLVFLCNAYHHFEDRVAYFSRLRSVFADGGRLVVLDGRSDGFASVLIPRGHWLEPGVLVDELDRAGFAHAAYHDTLPINTFDIFTLTSPGSALSAPPLADPR
jgi:ubiquinone/menaquinone biosynthesis C-methylase UbiE